jgi:hypothetical protein
MTGQSSDSRTLQILFWATLLFAISMGLMRLPAALDPFDLELHFLAFYLCACMAIVAFPRIPVPHLTLLLMAAGLALEGAQLLPVFGHAAELSDLAADFCGALAAMVPARLARWRLLRQQHDAVRRYSV